MSPKAGASGLRCAALCQHGFLSTRSYASSSSSVDGACMCSWALPQEDCPGECVACPQLPATWCSKSKNMTTAAIYTWDSDTGNLQFAWRAAQIAPNPSKRWHIKMRNRHWHWSLLPEHIPSCGFLEYFIVTHAVSCPYHM